MQLQQHSRMFLWGPSDAERNSCGLPCLVSSWHGQNAPWRLNSCDHKRSRGTPPRTLHPAGTREQSAGISTPKELSTWSMSDTPGNWVTIKDGPQLKYQVIYKSNSSIRFANFYIIRIDKCDHNMSTPRDS